VRAPRGLSPLRTGAVAIVVVALAAWLAFAGLPLGGGGFELRAAFRDVGGIDARSTVRVAGVDVGRVVKVEPAADGAEASIVTMRLEDSALQLHEDAELAVRPRLFLEGNVFIDLRPGTPSAPELDEGELVPVSQTAASVRLGDVLGTFRADTRKNLRRLLRGYGGAIGGEPRPGEDADQVRSVRGLTAGEALNRSVDQAPDALRGTALVSDALRGEREHDLSRLIAGGRRVAGALASREDELQGLVVRLNVTTAALAREERSLRASFRRLPRMLDAALPAFAELERALVPTRAFAREAVPGVRELPATIDSAFPWIEQTRRLVSRGELRGLVADLQPAVDDLAVTTDAAVPLLRRVDRVSRCALDVLLPTLNEKIDDGPLSTGIPNYEEFFQAMVGLTGESQNFDGNGPYTRLQPGGGGATVKTGVVPGQGSLFGNAAKRPLGTRPARPARRPPQRGNVPCHRNERPRLGSARTGGGP
jgi:phospholipid/cholesterol/gamma-HCH transport system substrate-binding protein